MKPFSPSAVAELFFQSLSAAKAERDSARLLWLAGRTAEYSKFYVRRLRVLERFLRVLLRFDEVSCAGFRGLERKESVFFEKIVSFD